MKRRLRAFLLTGGLALLLGVSSAFEVPGFRPYPRLLFVSRALPADPAQIPGFGPFGRTEKPGGRLLVRESSGRIHPFLPAGVLYDVSDPAVSWDGKWVAMAGTVSPDSSWRIWTCDAAGKGLHVLTDGGMTAVVTDANGSVVVGSEPLPPSAGDDLDPCWLPDGRLVFASTRYGSRSLAGPVPVTNLFSIHRDGTSLARVTLDRNGAEEPAVDVKAGRIVYSRWWFNPFRASEVDKIGASREKDRQAPADPIDFWQTIAVLPDGDGIKLAGGNPRLHEGEALYQPAFTDLGTMAGIEAENSSLSPAPGITRVVRFPGAFGDPKPLTKYGRAASPAALPDGRIVFSWDPTGHGDMDLYAVNEGDDRPVRVGGLPGFHDLDPVYLGRRRPPVKFPAPLLNPPPLSSSFTLDDVHTVDRTFRFDCLNVFTNAPVDAPFPDAPPLAQDVRIRFYTVFSRPDSAGGDSLILIREAPVTEDGAVHEHELPADIPLFEQLVDSRGRVLRNQQGLAHVPGFNFARMGSGTKCVGCHTGHSAIPAPVNNEQARWFNAAPSAMVTPTSTVPGTSGGRGAVDRRTKGPAERVTWMAKGLVNEGITLRWSVPLEVKSFTLYPPRDDRKAGTRLKVGSAFVVLLKDGREVGRSVIDHPLLPEGTPVTVSPTVIDGLEIRLGDVTGTIRHRPAAGLAEVSVDARLAGSGEP